MICTEKQTDMSKVLRFQITPKMVKPPFKTQRLQINADGQREDFNLEVYNPIIDRVTHIWNKEFQLVDFEKLRENSTQALKQKRLQNKEDFSQKPIRYTVATRVGKPYFSWRLVGKMSYILFYYYSLLLVRNPKESTTRAMNVLRAMPWI